MTLTIYNDTLSAQWLLHTICDFTVQLTRPKHSMPLLIFQGSWGFQTRNVWDKYKVSNRNTRDICRLKHTLRWPVEWHWHQDIISKPIKDARTRNSFCKSMVGLSGPQAPWTAVPSISKRAPQAKKKHERTVSVHIDKWRTCRSYR
jgi:hypothetical protein